MKVGISDIEKDVTRGSASKGTRTVMNPMTPVGTAIGRCMVRAGKLNKNRRGTSTQSITSSNRETRKKKTKCSWTIMTKHGKVDGKGKKIRRMVCDLLQLTELATERTGAA
jgi:hypothetical protein